MSNCFTVYGSRRWTIAFASLLGAMAHRLPAQLPKAQIIESDLAAIYRTAAATPTAAHRGPIMRELETLMIQQARFLVSQLQPWADDSRALRLPLEKGVASGEHGIRPSAHTAKGLALLVRLAPDGVFPPAFPRSQARAHALAILRYLLRTHGVSGETCADGKPWRNQWQSAYWAALTGEACWLLWEDLTPAERWLAARLVCDEADRFVGAAPPANVHRDTKAEENAWNSQVVSLAYNLFPHHPRHEAWRETAIRWVASSFATARDTTRTEVFDGLPLQRWVSGANLHDDFTLENHGRVHPDYMAASYLITSQLPMYAWGRNPPPRVIHLNIEAINGILKRLATPDGSVVYPNGQDWGLHRNIDWFEFHALMAVVYRDPQSAALMRCSLEAMQKMSARQPTGALYLTTETKLPSDQAMALEFMAHTYAIMAQLGEGPPPVPAPNLWSQLAGTHVFPSGRFGVVRARAAIATISWGAQVMAVVTPLRKDLLLTPETRGLIGYVSMAGQKAEVPTVKEIAFSPVADGVGVAGVLARGDGALEQRWGVLVLPDGRTIYADVIKLAANAKPVLLDGGTIGVLNDANWPFHNGKRTITHEQGTAVFYATNAGRDSALSLQARWLNLDGLGIVRLDSSGPARYDPKPTSAAGRLEQRFHLNATPPASWSRAKTGEVIAHSVLLFCPNQSPTETKSTAERCATESLDSGKRVSLRLGDGTNVFIDLENLRVDHGSRP